MPYKDKEKQKEYWRDIKRQQRMSTPSCNVSTPIEVDVERAAKLLLICNALDKNVTGLDGKRVNLLTMVRYGSIRMDAVKQQLAGV